MKLSTREFISLMSYLGIFGSIFSVLVNGDDPEIIHYIFWPSAAMAVTNLVRDIYDNCRGGAK